MSWTILSTEGIKVDYENIEVILEHNPSKCVIEMQSFLGMVGYYRRFMKGFSIMATPLT